MVSLSPTVKRAIDKINVFKPPKEAEEAGFSDFRPVNGWKPLFVMEPGPRTSWINEDLAPTPAQMRVWTWFSFVSLWWSQNYGAGAWSTGASLINAGLTVNQALGVSFLGCILTSLVGVAAARVGAVYHIGFPTWCRSTYGMYGSKIMVAFRGCVAIIWYAVQTYYGAQLLSVAFGAIFGKSWINLANHLPASSHTSTKIMICYFIMWLVQCPFAFIHPSAAKHIFTVKSLFLPISALAFIGGLVHLAGGSLDFTLVNPAKPAKGAAFSWAFLTGLNAIFGTISPMLINQPDIGRYAVRPSVALWPQFASMVTGKFIVFVLGIVSSAACKQVYGVTAWNVWDICNYILQSNFTANWRIGLALFGIIQCFGTVATNLFANSIPFGCDMAGVFPKWINIIRGQVICMLFSWAVCPWAILTSGAKFIVFLGSYTVFMAALMGILLADYYVIRRGNIHVPSLYAANGDKPNPDSIYMPRPKGYELKAFAAWVIGIAPLVPGLGYSYTKDTSAGAVAAKHMYSSGFIIAFFLGGVSYLVMCLFQKPEIVPVEYRGDFKPTWEALGKTDGYFPGEPEIFYGRSHMHGGDVEYAQNDGFDRNRYDSADIEEKDLPDEKQMGTQVLTRSVE
ncbi:hypothetical protein I317_06818 [Kwoniella heveanensis CBS 569]|nr:hypothetical protein I317_06818 [Kwoniella heveanensis CBS 569]